MNQLIADRQINYTIIPEVETTLFRKMVLDWYEYLCWDEESYIPVFTEDMMYRCTNTQEMFGNYLYELQEYEYVRQTTPERFHAEIFPVDMEEEYLDFHRNFIDEFRVEKLGEHEMDFFTDMMQVLDRHHMFYINKFRFDRGIINEHQIVFHNKPLKDVW